MNHETVKNALKEKKLKNKFFSSLIVCCLLFIVTGCLFPGCSSDIPRITYDALVDGKYDSEFFYRDVSAAFEEMSESVKLISSTAFYTTYVFADTSLVTLPKLKTTTLEQTALEAFYSNETVSGTGTIIYSYLGTVAILTCAHVVNSPDTLFAYFYDGEGKISPYLSSIAIKNRQITYVAGFPEGSDLDILAVDTPNDLALIGKRYSAEYQLQFREFSIPFGKAAELSWGSLTYFFGYPMKYKMLSKGIVSSPAIDEFGTFYINGVINRGFSGGPVLAIRDGVPNFELAGILSSVPIETAPVLRPLAESNERFYNPKREYTGEIAADMTVAIRYGMVKVIPVELITLFLERNKDYLNKQGFPITIRRPVENKR